MNAKERPPSPKGQRAFRLSLSPPPWAMLVLAVVLVAACSATSARVAPVTTAATVTQPGRVGALNPAVTQATIGQTICVPGWTATIRPPVSYTSKIKRKLAAAAGVKPSTVILDHIVPLEAGGAPADPHNFMLQPTAESRVKDRAENEANHRICDGQESLAAGQACFMVDWHTCPA